MGEPATDPAAAAPPAAEPAVVAPPAASDTPITPGLVAPPSASTGLIPGNASVVLPPGLAAPAPPGLVAPATSTALALPGQLIGKPKVLIVCDENLLFSAGIQEAYPDVEFTACTILTKPELERLNFDPNPRSLQGRVRHGTDPTKLPQRFGMVGGAPLGPGGGFDAIMLFLPGLACMVPPELGTADRPLFAFRVHWFFFHVVRHAKVLIRGDMAVGKLHVVWPDEAGLMTSPCGAAGIEIPQLATFCGCTPLPQEFDIEKLEADAFWPFLFGSIPSEPPEWLSGTTIASYFYDKSNIPVPLSVAMMLHPDIHFVCVKEPNSELSNPPGQMAPFRLQIQHEAIARRSRLREIYGHKESPDDVVGAFGLIPEPSDEDSMLCLPMEVFMLSLDDVPHLCNIMKYQITAEQLPATVPQLEILDPRLPTRIVRPKPTAQPAVAPVAAKTVGGRYEEWGGMKYFCPLTAICTNTSEKMRAHMSGDLYKRLAASTPGWEQSGDKKRLIDDLEAAEKEARLPPGKRTRTY